jgi:outer membrane immunogenic protein
LGVQRETNDVSMKRLKLLFAGVATLASGGAAQAADAAQPRVVKSPPPPPMPAFSWTGCHVGLHGGWGWGSQAVNARSSDILNTTSDVHTDGALLGGQAGCDYQFANGWVVGIEGDAAALNAKENIRPFAGQSDSVRIDTQWLASVTGRLGYAGLLPQTLVYVKGGGAWARQEYNTSGLPSSLLNGEFSKTFSGWTAGAGIAWAFSGNWSVFVEYNHYDFGGNFSRTAPSFVPDTINIEAPRIDTVKAGLNLRF